MLDVEERVLAEISEVLGANPSKLARHTNLYEHLGADSIDMIELMMALEDEFDIEIDDEEAERWRTVGCVIDHIGSSL